MTTALEKEIIRNCAAYHDALSKELLAVFNKNITDKRVTDGYKRLTAFTAMSVGISGNCSENSFRFFIEAQNDILSAHFLSLTGSFRIALVALRNAIEIILHFIYYKDHPIELIMWETGTHRLKFSQLFEYAEKHPNTSYDVYRIHISALKDEYATLSMAVHGSSSLFRMTGSVDYPNIICTDGPKLGMWHTRSSRVCTSLITILISHFQSAFKGAALPHQREVIAAALPAKLKSAVGAELTITL